jgi:hypothetical protein
MEAVLCGRREVSEVLTEAYSLRGDDLFVDPVPVCAGCPSCRNFGTNRFSFSLPEPTFVKHLTQAVDPAMTRVLGSSAATVFVSCPVENERMFRKRLLQFVLPRLAQLGIREFAAPADLTEERAYRQLYQRAQERFVVHREIDDGDLLRIQPRVPRVTLFLPMQRIPLSREIVNIERPLHLVFAWEDTPDRDRPGARLFDRTVHTRFNELVARLNQ